MSLKVGHEATLRLEKAFELNIGLRLDILLGLNMWLKPHLYLELERRPISAMFIGFEKAAPYTEVS